MTIKHTDEYENTETFYQAIIFSPKMDLSRSYKFYNMHKQDRKSM